MNLNEEKTFNRLVAWSRKHMPRWVFNSSGEVVGLRSPDGTFQVNSSGTVQPATWDSITGKPDTFPSTWAQVASKPLLFSGAYADLSGRPTLFSGAYGDLTGLPSLFPGTWAALTGKPALFDGVWSSLTGRPTTLAGAGITDAVSASALSAYLTASAAAAAYYPLGTNPAGYLTAAGIANKADKATTLAGYGITDALTGAALTTALGGYTTTAALTALLAAKADASSVKRIDTYIGTTDANGLYTVTYPTPFAAVPSVQPEPPALASQVWVKVSSTTAGFSLRLTQRNAATVLGLELLLAGTVNVASAPARVVVIAA